jgi:flagellum-specific peptidoglycan hydrolase FlgJ
MTSEQKAFLLEAAAAAGKAGHIFPQMAACEAAEESRSGTSVIAIQDNNLFGCKQHKHPIYGTHTVPTREFENGEWEVVPGAQWIDYPDWASCFADRMSTLKRLSPFLSHYARALAAQDPTSYLIQVSEGWSTDPGWECTCCSMFDSQAAAQQHAKDNPADPDHAKITELPGLGRALKVLAIYGVAGASVADWKAE